MESVSAMNGRRTGPMQTSQLGVFRSIPKLRRLSLLVGNVVAEEQIAASILAGYHCFSMQDRSSALSEFCALREEGRGSRASS